MCSLYVYIFWVVLSWEFWGEIFVHGLITYEKFLNKSISPMNETLTGTATLVIMVIIQRDSILPRSQELETHKMHFSLIPETCIFSRFLSLCIGYCQCILSPSNRVVLYKIVQLLFHFNLITVLFSSCVCFLFPSTVYSSNLKELQLTDTFTFSTWYDDWCHKLKPLDKLESQFVCK